MKEDSDITDRKQAEDSLQESERRYRSLFDNMLNGFAHCKMLFDEKGPTDFIYLDVNAAFETLTGLRNVTGQKVSDVIPGIRESDPELFEIYGRVALTGVPEQFETYLKALGMWLSISVYSPRKEYFVAVFEVITKRKRDEEDLRRYRDELEVRVQERTEELEKARREIEAEVVERRMAAETLRQTNRLLKLYTVGSSRKEYLDAVAALLQEWSGCEAIGIRALDKLGNIPYESYSGFSKEFWESECFLSTHTDQCICTRVAKREPDAQDLPYMTGGGSFICDDTGGLASTLSPKELERYRGKCISTGYTTVAVIPISYQSRVLGVVHLADRAKARIPRRTIEFIESIQPIIGDAIHCLILEEERSQLEVQLRQVHKMEALGTMAGGIAHDFNNMLAAIIGFAELVGDDLPEGSPQQRHIERILEAGMRGRGLIRQILAFSRQTELERKPLMLSSVVEESVKLLRAAIPATINIDVSVDRESSFIVGDPTQVQQVLMNLCTNAAHAMREKGGTLSIEGSDCRVGPTGRDHCGLEPGDYVRLVVRDTGVGMPPEIIDRIFDPFFTTKGVGEGTGLGLSVVLGIVKKSGGHVTVESEPGSGSTFTVYFPKAEAEPTVDTAITEEELPGGSERVLLVDDEAALVEMGKELLTRLGYSVACRRSSKEALALLEEDPFGFDLVITDQTMPDMTGLDIARQVLSIRPDMPVILLTGFSPHVNEESAKAAGIRGYAMKPLTKREIAGTVRKVLDG